MTFNEVAVEVAAAKEADGIPSEPSDDDFFMFVLALGEEVLHLLSKGCSILIRGVVDNLHSALQPR